MGVLPAFEELGSLCDAKGWRLELARLPDCFEIRVMKSKDHGIGVIRASEAAHLGDAAGALKAQIEQRV